MDSIKNYEILLEGIINEKWFLALENLSVEINRAGNTKVSGAFDQSALYSLFKKIRDLGVVLISVRLKE